MCMTLWALQQAAGSPQYQLTLQYMIVQQSDTPGGAGVYGCQLIAVSLHCCIIQVLQGKTP